MVANGGQESEGNGEEGQLGKIQVGGLEASCYIEVMGRIESERLSE